MIVIPINATLVYPSVGCHLIICRLNQFNIECFDLSHMHSSNSLFPCFLIYLVTTLFFSSGNSEYYHSISVKDPPKKTFRTTLNVCGEVPSRHSLYFHGLTPYIKLTKPGHPCFIVKVA